MRLFWKITKLSLQRHLTYRAATIAGLVTNYCFGIFRAAILVALYGSQQEVAGISIQEAVTYAALTQAIIGYLSLFHWFDLMATIHTGDIASDLLKPMDYFQYWLAQDLGRAVINFLFRGVTIILAYELIFNLTWPKNPTQWIFLGASLILSWVISFSWRFLINLSAFWSPNARGIIRFFFVLSWFFSGFLMPLRFFPDWVRTISYLTPFPHMLNTVTEIFLNILTGAELVMVIIQQMFWVLFLIVAGQLVYKTGVKRLVIQGG
jgi:ABC-2 type transport system permease protein